MYPTLSGSVLTCLPQFGSRWFGDMVNKSGIEGLNNQKCHVHTKQNADLV